MFKKVKVCVKRLGELAQKAWDLFLNVQNAPEQLPATWRNYQVPVIVILYMVSIGIAAYMTTVIVDHNPVISDLNEVRNVPLEYPSFLLCPDTDTKFDYSFFYRKESIRHLSLSVAAVNIVAKAAKEKRLRNDKLDATLESLTSNTRAKGMTLEGIWQNISSWQYQEFETDYDYYMKYGRDTTQSELYMNEHNFFNGLGTVRRYPPQGQPYDIYCDGSDWKWFDLDKLAEREQKLKPRRLEDSKETGLYEFIDTYSCRRIEGIWLEDNSYCMLWNNSNKLFKWNDADPYLLYFYMHPLAAYAENKKYRVWVGNLVTDEISLTTLHSGNAPTNGVYRMNEPTTSVCQPLIDSKCSHEGIIHSSYWIFFTRAVDLRKTKTDQFALFAEPNRMYFSLDLRKRHNGLQIAQIFSNLVGICNGFSIIALVKVILMSLKFRKLLGNMGVILIQTLIVVGLLIAAIVWQVFDFNNLSMSRFYHELDFVKSQNGYPYPSPVFRIESIQLQWNCTMLKEYNVSVRLVRYIAATAAAARLTKSEYFENINGTYVIHADNPKHFFWHPNADPEIGYHHEFMEFPLQYISENLYEEKMSEVEREYETLANQLGVNPTVPSWEMYTKLTLQPCRLISHCYINGKVEWNCCHRFRQSFQYQMGWVFDNENGKLRQRLPGKQFGLNIFWNTDFGNDMCNQPRLLYMDDFSKKKGLECARRYNDCITTDRPFQPGDHYLYNVLSIRTSGNVRSEAYHEKMKLVNGSFQLEGNTKVEMKMFLYQSKSLYYSPHTKCVNKPAIDVRQHKELYEASLIVYKKCGCYICQPDLEKFHLHDFKPCCTPKQAGRCLTGTNMTTSICRCIKNCPVCKCDKGMCTCKPKADPNKESVYAPHPASKKRIGNLDPSIPNLSILFRTRCDTNILFYDPKSNLSGILENMPRDLYDKQCDKTEWTQREGRGKPERHEAVTQEEKNKLMFNFYFEDVPKLVIAEKDRVNPIEILGLFSGSIGLLLGFTFVTIFELLLPIISNMMHNSPDGTNWSNRLVGTVRTVTFHKFYRRFHLLLGFTTNDTQNGDRIPVQDLQQQQMDETADELEKWAHKKIDKTEKKAPHGRNYIHVASTSKMDVSVDDESSDSSRIKKEVVDEVDDGADVANLENEAQDWVKKKLPGWAAFILLFLTVVGVILFTFTFRALLTSSGENPISVKYTLQHKNVSVPSMGICLGRSKSSRSSMVSQNLLKTLISFSTTSQCNMEFGLYIRTYNYDCMIFDSSKAQAECTITTAELHIVTIDKDVFFWAGSIDSIKENHVDAQYNLQPGIVYDVQYQQHHVISTYVCQNENDKMDCPICGWENMQEGFCCMDNSYPINNVSDIVAHYHELCETSFYFVDLKSEYSMEGGRNQSMALVRISSSYNVKIVVTKTPRQTNSEIFMLTAGFFDFFVAINVDNIAYLIVMFCATIIMHAWKWWKQLES